jgi:hypothetical protein
MLKGIQTDQEFNSSDEIEEAITRIWDDLTFDNVQSIFQNWISCPAWVIENRGEYSHESRDVECLCFVNAKIGGGPGTVITPCTSSPLQFFVMFKFFVLFFHGLQNTVFDCVPNSYGIDTHRVKRIF